MHSRKTDSYTCLKMQNETTKSSLYPSLQQFRKFITKVGLINRLKSIMIVIFNQNTRQFFKLFSSAIFDRESSDRSVPKNGSHVVVLLRSKKVKDSIN